MQNAANVKRNSCNYSVFSTPLACCSIDQQQYILQLPDKFTGKFTWLKYETHVADMCAWWIRTYISSRTGKIPEILTLINQCSPRVTINLKNHFDCDFYDDSDHDDLNSSIWKNYWIFLKVAEAVRLWGSGFEDSWCVGCWCSSSSRHKFV
jgi:hypothetical protein